jgi:putative hydroxymethylpyrimidine transport system substrate-binding protein
MRIVLWLLGLAVAAALLIGCGGGSKDSTSAASNPGSTIPPVTKEVHVILDGEQGPESLGILMAIQQGYFEEAGIYVFAGIPQEPNRPVGYVSSGIGSIGITQEPQLAIGKAKGAPVVSVGSLIDRPTAAMIWLQGSNIHGIADLKGKTIAIPGVPFQKAFLKAVLAQAGLTLGDVKVENARYELVPALVSGRADAIFGGSANIEGVELESQGEKPVVTPVQDLGIPDYEEDVVIAQKDLVAKDPKLIRDFMAAVARGTAKAIEDPRSAFFAIKYAVEAELPTDRETTEAEIEATLPLLSESGEMSPIRASHLVEWMQQEGMIQRKPPVSALLTNRYLP